MLELRAVSVAYGAAEAVRSVTLSVPAGSIVTVIGANGAGKTSLLNAAMGVIASSGAVLLGGVEQSHATVEARVAEGMVLVPERRELFASMSVEDNLRLGAFRAGARGAMAEGLDSVFRRFPRLQERRRQLAGTLSGGERQMLALGRAIMTRPRLLMLDEPSLGLAPRIVGEAMRAIATLRDSGVSILLVEQNARAALAIADYAYVMELGAVALEGAAGDLAKDARVIESYLGLGAARAAV